MTKTTKKKLRHAKNKNQAYILYLVSKNSKQNQILLKKLIKLIKLN
jgi:hypothetical protein